MSLLRTDVRDLLRRKKDDIAVDNFSLDAYLRTRDGYPALVLTGSDNPRQGLSDHESAMLGRYLQEELKIVPLYENREGYPTLPSDRIYLYDGVVIIPPGKAKNLLVFGEERNKAKLKEVTRELCTNLSFLKFVKPRGSFEVSTAEVLRIFTGLGNGEERAE